MPLESLVHTAALHKLGNEAVSEVTLKSFPHEKSNEPRPKIPSPDLFNFNDRTPPTSPTIKAPSSPSDDSSSTSNGFNQLPNVADCAAHLELLEVFYIIRQKILVSKKIDDAMDIHPKKVTKTGKKGDTKTLKDSTFWTRRQEKWNRYLEFAAVRFLAWSKALTSKDVVSKGPGPRVPKVLPPLDILMVWHSFLLNPRLFHEECGKDLIWKIRLPWEDIHAAIDSDDWTFSLDSASSASYETKTGLPADLFKSFEDWPPYKPGTTTSTFGTKADPGKDGSLPLSDFSLLYAVVIGPVKGPLDTMLKKQQAQYIKLFHDTNVHLATKLKEAVIRQATFVDKMNAHLWIRSPAVEGTIRRAIDRYTKFLGILARGKKFTIVPTLDVDLAWHTNQCFSGIGYTYTMKQRVGRFINHDDTIEKESLGDGFGETRKLWRIYYGKEYRVCGCWDCEALTSEIEKVSSPSDLDKVAAKVEKEVQFHRLVEIWRRRGLAWPSAA
ncbi:glycine-rich domain-containing protein-like domain-containing protein [Sarocladium implicatum]|nr:glycine-rich domain-containing protein-like domain-containing protein [Sarocladium implicatum]